MIRLPHDTTPMGLPADTARTEPGAPPVEARSRVATEPGPPPDMTSTAPTPSRPDHDTDPGLDPLLKAFNRAPRPPAPQPNRRASSDGDEFVVHYAGPQSVAVPAEHPIAAEPAILVELADLARPVTLPIGPGPASASDPAPPVQNDVETFVTRRRERSFPTPGVALGLALGLGALIALPLAFFFFQSPPHRPGVPGVSTESVSVVSSASPAPSAEASERAPVIAVVSSQQAPSPSLAPSTSTVASVRSTSPSPTSAQATTRPATPAMPRTATSEHAKPPVPSRPVHENPETTL